MAKLSSSECLEAQLSEKCSLKAAETENKTFECVPLMLLDVKRCRTSSPTVFEAFDGKIYFRTIVVHGRIVSKVIPSKPNAHYRFELDDNTSVLPLLIPKKEADILELQRLRNEVFARKSVEEHSDILTALQQLLNKTRKQLDPSSISVGHKIFVIGKPDFFRDRVGIFGLKWDIDTGSNRIIELVFKDEIIDWYTKIYKISK